MHLPATNAHLIRAIADALLAVPVGDVVTYATLSEALGSPVQERLYLVMQAITVANQQAGALFRNIRMVGYLRMQPDLAHSIGREARHIIRRRAVRAGKTITNAIEKANDISPDAMLRAYSEQCALGLLQHMTYDRNVPVAITGERPPPVSETVRASVAALRQHMMSAA